MPAILDVKDLSLSLIGNRSKTLVNSLNFSLEKGETLGIVGESGSGKSLTALSLIRLLPPEIVISSGEILIPDGDRIINLVKADRKSMLSVRGRKIAMIFQEPMTSLNPSMKCGRQVEEVIRLHKTSGPLKPSLKVIELLNEVNLPRPEEIYHSYPHQLSGGQRQRLMIAMALAADPGILIADEPTTALDVTVQKSIIKLLLQLKMSRHLAILFISHDLRLVREISDRIMVMRQGLICEIASPTILFNTPKSSYTKGLIACQPPLDKKPLRLLTINEIEKGYTPPNINLPPREIDYNTVPLLRIENLTIHYPIPGSVISNKRKTITAVETIDLTLYSGETLGLVGESGCGKTSIGKAILKLLTYQQGSIYFRGVNIKSLKGHNLKEYRSSVQVVFQDPFSSLNPKRTVQQMLEEALRVHKPKFTSRKRNSRISELLSVTGLEESDRNKYPHQFSGGQRQRLCIARSLVPEPVFLILDESVSALDVSVQAQILNLLNDLKQTHGLSYLFISHDLSVVRYMSDRIMVMKSGKIEEEGNPDKIFHSPLKEYTRVLISSIPGYQYSSASTS